MHNILCEHANKLIKSKCIHLCVPVVCSQYISSHSLTHSPTLIKSKSRARIHLYIGHTKQWREWRFQKHTWVEFLMMMMRLDDGYWALISLICIFAMEVIFLKKIFSTWNQISFCNQEIAFFLEKEITSLWTAMKIFIEQSHFISVELTYIRYRLERRTL